MLLKQALRLLKLSPMLFLQPQMLCVFRLVLGKKSLVYQQKSLNRKNGQKYSKTEHFLFTVRTKKADFRPQKSAKKSCIFVRPKNGISTPFSDHKNSLVDS